MKPRPSPAIAYALGALGLSLATLGLGMFAHRSPTTSGMAQAPPSPSRPAHGPGRVPAPAASQAAVALPLPIAVAVPESWSDQASVPGHEEAPLARARDAIQSGDASAFSQAFQDLLDAGEAGKLDAAELLPAAEGLFADGSDQERWNLVHAIAGMEGPQAGASLRRLFAQAEDPPTRAMVVAALAQGRSGEVDAVLWEWVDACSVPTARDEVWQALASRPGNADRILQRLKDPALPVSSRTAVLEGLVQGSEGERQSLWALYDADPSLKAGLLEPLLRYRDPRAVAIVMDQVKLGDLSEALAGELPHLDARTLRKNAQSLRAMAGGISASVRLRIPAFQALYRVEPRDALDAVLAGFPGLPEEDRLQVVRGIHAAGDGGREAQAALDLIAATDASPQVRSYASSAP